MPEQQKRLLAERYELISPIGRGTMGTVWRAHDRALGREVAIKEIRQDPGLTEEQRAELRERMVREGRTAARINHPSVASIHDVLIQDNSPWIIMELVEARSLEQVIEEEGPLPPRLVAEIGVDLLGALRAAHAQGVTHRDVKPGNVLITESGRVVLTDFGIAKAEGDTRLTKTGMVIGSPGYTAPERARGEYTGPESDIWSLGATLYFAVEGRPAYERATVAETLAALMTENADAPTQAGPLRPVLEGMLHKDHRQRLTAATTETMLRMVADTPTSDIPKVMEDFDPDRTMTVQRPKPAEQDDQSAIVTSRLSVPPTGLPASPSTRRPPLPTPVRQAPRRVPAGPECRQGLGSPAPTQGRGPSPAPPLRVARARSAPPPAPAAQEPSQDRRRPVPDRADPTSFQADPATTPEHLGGHRAPWVRPVRRRGRRRSTPLIPARAGRPGVPATPVLRRPRSTAPPATPWCTARPAVPAAPPYLLLRRAATGATTPTGSPGWAPTCSRSRGSPPRRRRATARESSSSSASPSWLSP